jgi:hypothetical protein
MRFGGKPTLKGGALQRQNSGTLEISFQELVYDEKIGKGSYGVVYRGTWRGGIVAISKRPFLVSLFEFLLVPIYRANEIKFIQRKSHSRFQIRSGYFGQFAVKFDFLFSFF